MDQPNKIKWTPPLIALTAMNVVMLLIIIAALAVVGYSFFFKIFNFIVG